MLEDFIDVNTSRKKTEGSPVAVESLEKALSFKRDKKLIFRFDADYDPDDVDTPVNKRKSAFGNIPVVNKD